MFGHCKQEEGEKWDYNSILASKRQKKYPALRRDIEYLVGPSPNSIIV